MDFIVFFVAMLLFFLASFFWMTSHDIKLTRVGMMNLEICKFNCVIYNQRIVYFEQVGIMSKYSVLKQRVW